MYKKKRLPPTGLRQAIFRNGQSLFYYEILVNQICKMKMNLIFRVRADESLYAFILLSVINLLKMGLQRP